MPDGDAAPKDAPMSRRSFVRMLSGLVALVGAAAMGIPLIASVVAPTARPKKQPYDKVGEVAELPLGIPVSLAFTELTADAYVHMVTPHNVFALKRSPTDVVVYSPVCPHLGCQVGWDNATKHFLCPCHGSVFDITGKVLAGPAPRPLDILPSKVAAGALHVQWQNYRPAIPQKVLV